MHNGEKDNYTRFVEKEAGVSISPPNVFHEDGYVNALNKYGTSRDTSEHYEFVKEPPMPDTRLEEIYEGNGLFARIIDAPAEEATKHGFTLDGVKDEKIISYAMDSLDDLEWEEVAQTCLKWQRLFGGAIAVMLIDDGRGIDEPLDWKHIKGIEDVRIYDRSVVQPDYQSMFAYSPQDPIGKKGGKLGTPEYYHVYSKYGVFNVHESRCLVFKNGVLPEKCSNSVYELWGMPEYIRIKRELRSAEVAHQNGPKMLDKSVQAVYSMKGLSEVLAREGGDDIVVKRLQAIDLARGLCDSIAIDADGESYDFKTFSYTGVSDIINITCNMLSAITNIPQTILFGRSPSGMDATGNSDLENWYNFIERIQKKSLKNNLRKLLSVIFHAGKHTGKIDKIPDIKIKFDPLWSMSETEQVQLEQMKASVQSTKAQTASAYVQMGVLDPTEIRQALADEDEMDIDTMLDDIPEDELFENMPQQGQQGGMPGQGGAPGGDIMQAMMGQMSGQAQGANPETQKQAASAPSQQGPEGQDASTQPTEEQTETSSQNVHNAPQAAMEELSTNPSTQQTIQPTKQYRRLIIVQDGKVLAGKVKHKNGKEYIDCPKTHASDETLERDIQGLVLHGCGIKGAKATPIDAEGMAWLVTDTTGNMMVDKRVLTEPAFYSMEELNASKTPLAKSFVQALNAMINALPQEEATQEDDAHTVIEEPQQEAETSESIHETISETPATESNSLEPAEQETQKDAPQEEHRKSFGLMRDNGIPTVEEKDMSLHTGAVKERKPVDLDKLAYEYAEEHIKRLMKTVEADMSQEGNHAGALQKAAFSIHSIEDDVFGIAHQPVSADIKELLDSNRKKLVEYWATGDNSVSVVNEDDEKNKGGFNNKLPYGLCKAAGIEVPEGTDWSGAWELFTGKTGITQEEAFKQLNEKGKVTIGLNSWEYQESPDDEGTESQQETTQITESNGPNTPDSTENAVESNEPEESAEERKITLRHIYNLVQQISSHFVFGETAAKYGQTFSDDSYTQERKDNAVWAKSTEEARVVLEPYVKKIYSKLTYKQKKLINEYSWGSAFLNACLEGYQQNGLKLHGCEGRWRNYVGIGNVTLTDEERELIDMFTEICNLCELEEDMWMQHGANNQSQIGLILGLEPGKNITDKVLKQIIKDDKPLYYGPFCSLGAARGTGFTKSKVICNFYLPKGTKGVYVSPVSHYGGRDTEEEIREFDGSQNSEKYTYEENEFVLQRGSVFKLRGFSHGIDEEGKKHLYLDFELVEQAPNEI